MYLTMFSQQAPQIMGNHDDTDSGEIQKPRTINLFGREIELPRSRIVRIGIGVLLIFFGILGFLPILGFWMIPLGLLVLSYEFAMIRRLRRKAVVQFSRREKSD